MTAPLDVSLAGYAVAPLSVFDRAVRRRFLAQMAALKGGRVHLIDPWGEHLLGNEASEAKSALPVVTCRVKDVRFYRALALRGSVGAAEAWIDGAWECAELVELVRLLVRNRDRLDAMEGGMAVLGRVAMRAWHALRPNTRDGSRKNIAAHYDLGNAFFERFLSTDMMYSSAWWDTDTTTLEEASTRKLDRVCEALGLRPGLRVVEIGTGWGGFALHAARHYGCHVTTTTISAEQHALAVEKVRAAGLSGQIEVLASDYRDLSGQFDRLVSIEMIEAIGAAQMETYFRKIGDLLRPDGMALVQAITIEDHRYAQALASVDFIKRHVFPGSFIPSLQAMLEAKTRASDLALVYQQDFGISYARTLHAWAERFMHERDAVQAMGFDASFIRLWQFYLAYCEGGFLERSIGVSHLLFARPDARPESGQWVRATGVAA
ncbi:cyclopropane-fatty-acyl-phospholipid synthase [Luteibacter sp. UNCMF331Sha3.1]|uniref:SAM-dependent methyltransferase n=1 Tax=Luteibacter sp. UNCMF331Sha3.1 TaxID=1502760 RepID=UPI0008CA681E|nr:cyclopropane-fatty-acyl-phospholipid synthase family protein [Luteibacter sp. UNCMF331Sha3.1]SEN17803.1 cyclopropane-fatty-acyl-phospholipid synthase [Luteibacter sp. UNCMF331Sha3.1]